MDAHDADEERRQKRREGLREMMADPRSEYGEDENTRTCDSCWGTGVDDEGAECSMCGGLGYLTDGGTHLALLVFETIRARAHREGLWEMPLQEIDLETMAEEIVEALQVRRILEAIIADAQEALECVSETGSLRDILAHIVFNTEAAFRQIVGTNDGRS